MEEGREDSSFFSNLIEWKISFGQVFIYHINEHSFAFRPLFVKETEALFELSSKIDEYIIDDWIVSKTILSSNADYLLEKAPAGWVSVIANSILAKSTSKSIEDTLVDIEKERGKKNTAGVVIDYIVKMGAGNLLKDTKNLTHKQQIQYLVFSEEVTGKKFEIQKQTLPPKMVGKKLSPEAAAILSKEAADIPDFIRDNAELRDL